MSTRETRTTGTLTQRLTNAGFFATERSEKFIRAELNRLERQVREELKNIHANTVAYKKSKEPMDYILYERGLAAESTLNDVLALIEEAKR